MNDRPAPGTQIMIFLGLTFLLSIIMQAILIRHMVSPNLIWMLLLSWIPGAVGIACSFTFGHNYQDLGLKMPVPRFFVWAYGVPAIAALLVLTISVIIGIGELELRLDKGTMNRLIFAPTVGILVAAISTAGEELGWRGFLHSRMQEVEVQDPNFMIGAIWAVWRWPLILFGIYATSRSPVLNAALFTITLISFSIFLGQLREASKSVWPVVIAHAVHNTWIQGIYPYFYKAGALDPLFGGETGVILAILYLSFAIYLQRKPVQ